MSNLQNNAAVISIDDLEDSVEFSQQEYTEVADDMGAAFAFRNVAVRDNEINRIKQIADSEIARIKEWQTMEVERLEKQKKYFLFGIEDFLRSVNEQSQGKIKSLKYPIGVIQLRKNPDRVVVADDFDPAAAKAASPDDPFLVEHITVKVDIAGIKKSMKETGIIPEYAQLVEGDTSFSYKLE